MFIVGKNSSIWINIIIIFIKRNIKYWFLSFCFQKPRTLSTC